MHFASSKADASWSEKVFKLCKKNKKTLASYIDVRCTKKWGSISDEIR